jgi:2-amino-4-hydroxy-6-hydroxymethyldihydropteridine diphosphokinase
MERVADLMAAWAEQRDGSDAERTRWRAAAWLHDCLRDAPAERLRPWVEGRLARLPASFLHGPATAARLEAEGVDDADLLAAVRYHTLGWPGLAAIGRALIIADYLDPGRPQHAEWRAQQRARMPDDMDEVLRAVVRAKLEKSLHVNLFIQPEMLALWNSLANPDP